MIQDLLSTVKVSVCRNPVWQSDFKMIPHSHNTLEIIYIKKGVMTLQYEQETISEEVTISSNQFAILFPHTVHRYYSNTPQCEFLVLELILLSKNVSFLQYLCSRTFIAKIPQLLSLLSPNTKLLTFTDNNDVLEQLKEIHRLVGEEGFNDDVLARVHYSIALERLLYSICSCRIFYFRAGGNTYIRKSMLLIHDRYVENLSVNMLAQAVGITPSYLQRLFKHEFHMTVMEIVHLQRLKNACHLLQTTNTKLTEIAMRTGFKSLNSFYKFFVKTYGEPPGDYRKKHIERTKVYTDTPKDYFDKVSVANLEQFTEKHD